MGVVDFPGRHPTFMVKNQHSGGGGDGGMDDILKRLGAVEGSVSEIKSEVSGLTATAQHLATKSDVSNLESSLIKWIVGTLLAVAIVTFTIARFIKGS